MIDQCQAEIRQITAEQRGMEMMLVPMGQLPPLATEYAKKLCREVGGCMETFLTAWTVYAQCVEGLDCTDKLYKARDEDKKWFNERMNKKKEEVA